MKKAEQANFPEFEQEILKVWEKEKTFEKSLKNREGAKRFSFYDGPPFANGLPHYGHVVPVTLKDAITRYKTMQGYYAPRRNGWDTHGLPVETEVEKELGIKSKRDIYKYGVDKFIEASRNSVFKYRKEWEQFFTRMGRWADQENAYATLDDSYMESVWWVISELDKKKLLAETFRSMPYCPRCATPLSNFEVNQNYKDNVTDPSVFVKFKVQGEDNTSLLAWTTTPWTLPANAALAVDVKADYATVQFVQDGDGWAKGEKVILAKKRVQELEVRESQFVIMDSQKGKELVGLRYEPLYTLAVLTDEEKQTAHKVYADASVSLEDGTGILHVAPRYGETDLELGLRENLPLIESVDSNGHMTEEMGEFAGKWFKTADPLIVADLVSKGRIFAAETFEHTYPFCWRCESPLLYFAISNWVVKVTELRKQLVKNNKQIKWVPEHIKEGRFGHWLADARDWSISRNRFWGNPLPIWKCEDGHVTVIGSIAELKKKAVDPKLINDLHRPAIDEVKIQCPHCQHKATRIEEVLDCWFESGAMPYAQDHYPFENEGAFKDAFPADFIAEGLDQTRGWFYTLHVLASALYDKPAFKNVAVNGLVLAADGKKLSKRLKNYPPLEDVFDTVGVDVLRYFMMGSPVVAGEDVRFSKEALADVQRNVFMRLWNVWSFMSTYAEVDKWKPAKELKEPQSASVLDQWLLARLNQAIAEASKQADDYQVARAIRPISELIDDLSNWYVRRSRRRFWKSEDDGDKQSAYETLHYTLARISQLLAPWSPFIADKLWRELTDGMNAQTSVHLSDWPKAGKFNASLLDSMGAVREAITVGLSERAQAGIKVRQPLAEAIVLAPNEPNDQLLAIAAEELNVKNVKWKKASKCGAEISTDITEELKLEGIARDIIRQIQSFRKQSGLEVDDRIELSLKSGGPDIVAAIEAHAGLIKDETLAVKLGDTGLSNSTSTKVAGVELTISLEKA